MPWMSATSSGMVQPSGLTMTSMLENVARVSKAERTGRALVEPVRGRREDSGALQLLHCACPVFICRSGAAAHLVLPALRIRAGVGGHQHG